MAFVFARPLIRQHFPSASLQSFNLRAQRTFNSPRLALHNDPHVAQLWSPSTNSCSFCGEKGATCCHCIILNLLFKWTTLSAHNKHHVKWHSVLWFRREGGGMIHDSRKGSCDFGDFTYTRHRWRECNKGTVNHKIVNTYFSSDL